MSSSPHLRGIVIAGVLAVIALGLGFVTLGMNQSASVAAGPTATIVPLKDRRPAGARTAAKTSTAAAKAAVKTKTTAKAKAKHKPLDPNMVAALKLGLPRSIAHALAARPVAVVALTSREDPVDEMASAETKAGAGLAGASYVAVSVDRDGGDASTLTRVLGTLPSAPASLVYARPGTLVTTLVGFNDHTTVQQAAASALAAWQAAQAEVRAAKAPATSPTAAATPVKPKPLTWAQSANRLCRSEVQELAALGGPSNAPLLARNQVKFETESERFLSRLRAVKAAPGKAAAVAKLDSLLAKYYGALDEMVAAQIRHDAPGVAAAQTRARVLASEAVGLEKPLGASACEGRVA